MTANDHFAVLIAEDRIASSLGFRHGLAAWPELRCRHACALHADTVLAMIARAMLTRRLPVRGQSRAGKIEARPLILAIHLAAIRLP